MKMENKTERYVSYYISKLDISKRFFDKDTVFSHADFDGPVLISRLSCNSMSFDEFLARMDNTSKFSRFLQNGHIYHTFDTDDINYVADLIVFWERQYAQYFIEFDSA